MYEEFFGLQGKPFQLSPDPRFFFESQGHRRALAYLRYGIQQGEGFVVVTGKVGTGKTTLAQTLFNDLGRNRNAVAAQIVTTQVEGEDLLRMVADGFGLAHEGKSKATLLHDLEAFLIQKRHERKRVLLLIDEAQNLPPSSLEALRMLSNFQEGRRPLLQSLLLGQAEFRQTLQSPHLEQVRQRIIASCHLDPLSVEETERYIRHRLEQVAWNNDPELVPEAFTAIQRHTRGVPRRINTFCDRLLLFAYLEELHRIEPGHVGTVAEELRGEIPEETRPEETRETAAPVPAGSRDRITALERRISVLEEALRHTRNGLNRLLVSEGQP
ncbi:MAG TPA: XrtA/PEP-CTERM system-associated ATPase [Gammaproteobacteria bacterium]|nr:XrtA/PEP-CTERM system-associated ATPase [Gammaproteobacteria bacterium]